MDQGPATVVTPLRLNQPPIFPVKKEDPHPTVDQQNMGLWGAICVKIMFFCYLYMYFIYKVQDI